MAAEPAETLVPLDWSAMTVYAPDGGGIEYWSTTQFGGERFIAAEDIAYFAKVETSSHDREDGPGDE